jgi:hypothetical protein
VRARRWWWGRGIKDVRLLKTLVESVAGEDKETGLDVEACGAVVVLEGELRRGQRVWAAASRFDESIVGARE